MCQDCISLVFTHDSADFSSCPEIYIFTPYSIHMHTELLMLQCGCLYEVSYSNDSK